MSKHVSEWLNAYHDGELRGSRLQHVEAHLAACEVCQAELESLEGLSALLHEVPAPEFTSPERFASQVSRRLPHKQTVTSSSKRILEIGWWMIPVGLLAVWIFMGTSFFINDLLSTAASLGLLSGISDWMTLGPSSDIYLSATLSQLGLLSGNSLSWVESTESIARMSLPQISLQISIALLYLSWLAIWWARRQRQQRGQLLEG